MKTVLHFSDNNLPDIRVEKFAYLQKNNNFRTVFVGGTINKSIMDIGLPLTDLFDETHVLNSSKGDKLNLPLIHSKYKKNFKTIVEETQPDIIHAHNIFAARTCMELGLDYIYDDHEYWTYQAIARKVRPKSFFDKNRITDSMFSRNIAKWEPKVVHNAKSVISVSSTILDHLASSHGLKDNKKLFTIPNFPTTFEIDNIKKWETEKDPINLKTLLVTKSGGYFFEKSGDKFLSSFSKSDIELSIIGKYPKDKIPDNVKSYGWLSHEEFVKKLQEFHIGLTQFGKDKLDEYYRFLSPNRIYFYSHSGVIPVLKHKMEFLQKLIGDLAIYVDNEAEAVTKISELKKDMDKILQMSANLKKLAREKFIFENQLDQMLQAYDMK